MTLNFLRDYILFTAKTKINDNSDKKKNKNNEWVEFLERIVVVQSLSGVRLFATPWTAAHQASLSFTISQSLLKLMSIESVMPSNCLVPYLNPLLLLPLIFPSIRAFPLSWLFASGGQRTGASASASVLPMNIQGWFPLGLTGLISFLSKELSWVFSGTMAWKHQFFGTQPSLWFNSHMTTGKIIAFIIGTFVGKVMCLLFNTMSRLVIAFLPRSKWLPILWL